MKDPISRRVMLKRIGAGAAVAWTVPVLTTIRTPAFAGSPTPGACIVLPSEGRVTTTVTFHSGINDAEYGLASPSNVVVCSPCLGGETADLGTFAAGTELRFYIKDLACNETFTCPDQFIQVTQTSPTTWSQGFDDAGFGCVHHDPPCYCNIGATVTLT